MTAYANKIGSAAGTTVEGKLMSLEEAYTFKNSGTAGSNAVKDKNSYHYWLVLTWSSRFGMFVVHSLKLGH